MCWVLKGMCVLGVEGDVRWGGEGDVCAGCRRGCVCWGC